MTPLERLLLEAVPTRPAPPTGTHNLWTQQEQDRHWTALCEAVGTPGAHRPQHTEADAA